MSDSYMPGMTLAKITQVLDAQYIGPEEDLDKNITNVTMDSRQAGAGTLFFAIKGERADGHSFIEDVFGKGAYAVICEHATDAKGAHIVVKNSVSALQKLSAYYRTQIKAGVVMITGSVGKTSTKEMIASVLSEHFNVLKTNGNYNNEIGLPLTVFRIKPEHELVVLEAGIDEPGEMDIIADSAKPDVCVITNIGICHLENLGSRQGIFDEKTRCFKYMQQGGIAVLNADNDLLSEVKSVNGKAPVFFGVEQGGGKSFYVTDERDLGYDGSQALLCTPAGNINIHVNIPGIHQLSNAAAAAAVGAYFGLSLEEICAGIEHATTISGRTNLIHTTDYLLVDDCYNANPASMEAAILLLTKAKGRKIAVLGDMGELGPDEKALHRQVGDYAARNPMDMLFTCGKLSEEIYEGAKTNSQIDARHFAIREEMIAEIKKCLRPGDTVLIKASHFMDFAKVVEALRT